MNANLDWSYRLLEDAERLVLFRIAIFTGEFTLSAACKSAADAEHPEDEIVDKVMELVAKSLVTVNLSDDKPRFRLFETTRTYAQTKLAETDDCDTMHRHRLHEFSHGNTAVGRVRQRANRSPLLAAVSQA